MTILPFQSNAAEPAHDVVDVTPETAIRWLANNERNRRLNDAKAAQYARDMRAGNWQFNGDPIRFDAKGRLLDGQHRLTAIKMSGTTQRMLVITNLPETTQDTMDIGRPRRMSDQLQISEEAHSTLLAAVLRIVTAYELGARAFSTASPTQAEMRNFLRAHPQVRRAAELASKARKYVPAMPSAFGATYFLAARKDVELAELFFAHQLLEGTGLHSGDPAHTLLRRLSFARSTGQRMVLDDQIRYILLAWNAFRDGRHLVKLQAPKGGWTTDSFPEPR